VPSPHRLFKNSSSDEHSEDIWFRKKKETMPNY